jgi:energy-coupling factor transporter ATP-binding protein EcfA2
VYISDQDRSSFYQDIMAFRDLLSGPSFFKPKEIILLLTDTPGPEGSFEDFAIKFLEFMDSDTLPPFNIISVGNNPTFDTIYQILMGTSSNPEETFTQNILYLVEKGTEAKVSYEEDETPLKVEDFDFSSLKLHEMFKETSRKQDSGEVFYDPEKTSSIRKLDLEFPRVIIKDLKKSKVTLIGGHRGSGLTTFLSALAVSSSHVLDRILIIENSERKNVEEILSLGNISFNLESLQSFLSEGMHCKKGITVLDYKGVDSVSVLNLISSQINKDLYDLLLIDSSIDFLRINKMFENNKPHIFFTTLTGRSYLSQIIPLSYSVSNCDIILNNIHKESRLNSKSVSPEEIKAKIPSLGRLFKPMNITHLAIDSELYDKLLGGI